MPVSRDYLVATRPLIETRIGRPLRLAEQHVDVLGLTRTLDGAKDEIERAIRAEQKRAIARALRDGGRIRLTVTRPILEPLEKLWRHGRREAAAELQRAGYTVPRVYAQPEHAHGKVPELADLEAKLLKKINGLSVTVESQRVTLAMAADGPVGAALASALLDVLGARSIAAGAVSTAMFGGMGATFEENQDLIGQWEYSSVLDGGTCDVCAPLDGTTYESWDAIQDVLPDGGPNPDCEGGDRCRCRAVPAPA